MMPSKSKHRRVIRAAKDCARPGRSDVAVLQKFAYAGGEERKTIGGPSRSPAAESRVGLEYEGVGSGGGGIGDGLPEPRRREQPVVCDVFGRKTRNTQV